MSDHHTMCPHCGQLIGDKPVNPVCPECHGQGFVTITSWGPNSGGYGQRACSKGCPPVYTVNMVSAA